MSYVLQHPASGQIKGEPGALSLARGLTASASQRAFRLAVPEKSEARCKAGQRLFASDRLINDSMVHIICQGVPQNKAWLKRHICQSKRLDFLYTDFDGHVPAWVYEQALSKKTLNRRLCCISRVRPHVST